MKVLLVEDEIMIREGIAAAIDWQEYGFELCGQSGDGEEALRFIDRLNPDIVITDIQMPRMTGLELIVSAKRLQPLLEFIILSGHNDFAYAKTAIQFGVNDYLLKPCKPEELLDILLRTKQKITKSREAEYSLHRSRAAVMEISIARWLRSPKQPLENREGNLKEWNVSLRPKNVFVGVVRFDVEARKSQEETPIDATVDLELIRYAAENIMKETLEAIYQAPLIVIRQEQSFIWIANQPTFNRITLSDHKNKLSMLQDNLEKYLRVSVSIGVGQPVLTLDELHFSYVQATEAISARFYKGRGSIVYYSELRGNTISPSEAIRDNQSMDLLEQDIVHQLRTLRFEEALDLTEVWLDHLRHNPQFGQSGAKLKTTAFLLELQKLAQESTLR